MYVVGEVDIWEVKLEEKLMIVGGGLVGSMLAALLAPRYQVTVFEKRGDPRVEEGDSGRSINLVLTSRGLHALEKIGLTQKALDISVPVYGRMVHQSDSSLTYQPYSSRRDQCNYSISRAQINQLLLSHAERRGAEIKFHHELVDVSFENRRIKFLNKKNAETIQIEGGRIFGADGTGSRLRQEMFHKMGTKMTLTPLGHDYKELYVSPEKGVGWKHSALHIWPRQHFMLMALPNLDGSFTLTLYLPEKGKNSFADVATSGAMDFFQRHFPDAVDLVADLEEGFKKSPIGKLGTVRCFPWHQKDFCTLIGDAAHGIVPFFGQGMNCGFEDAVKLEGCIENSSDWLQAFESFGVGRKPNTNAVATMSLENFEEMSALVGHSEFQLEKAIEHILMEKWPAHFQSRYGMVAYSLIPYAEVYARGQEQKDIIKSLAKGLTNIDDLDLSLAQRLVTSLPVLY